VESIHVCFVPLPNLLATRMAYVPNQWRIWKQVARHLPYPREAEFASYTRSND
jgi:hypothetical protein